MFDKKPNNHLWLFYNSTADVHPSKEDSPGKEERMLRIKLGPRFYVGDKQGNDSFAPRQHAGWDPTMTEKEVYDAARVWWRLSERAEREKYAIVVAEGLCRMAIEIKRWETSEDRRGFEGRILKPGDRVYDKFVGKPDPAESTSRFPVLYLPDEVDEELCRCGCGETVSRGEWVQGHDQRAIHARIRNDFNGSVSKFIDWYDDHRPATATAS